MRRSVKMLSVFLIVLSISGCSEKIVVPQKCDVSVPEEPSPVKLISSNPFEHAKNMGRNYKRLETYAAKLRDALQVCTNK